MWERRRELGQARGAKEDHQVTGTVTLLPPALAGNVHPFIESDTHVARKSPAGGVSTP
jgi:hypothetical protein